MELIIKNFNENFSNNFSPIYQILKFSLKNYNIEITNFTSYVKKEKSSTGKWFELIYCILAGTQVRTQIVKKSYESLFDIIGTDLILENVANSDSIRQKIENVLKSNGYRFYSLKTNSIIQTAKFFINYDYNPDNFLKKSDDFKILRNELKKIKGIGIKIASHWLRNLGFEIPIIDIHIKNLLIYTSIINEPIKSYIEYEDYILELQYKLNINLFLLDLSLWIFGRENCANRKCNCCILKDICLKEQKSLKF